MKGWQSDESQEPTGDDDALVLDAASSGTLIPLTNLNSTFPDDKISLSYAESSAAIRYMIKKRGTDAPRLLLSAIARTGSLDRSMLATMHRSEEQFTNDWFDQTTKRYWTLRLFRISTGILSAAMALLAVLAFFARRKQKLEAARQWEQEEFEEALRRQQGNDWSE